jgi:hypothetical protein
MNVTFISNPLTGQARPVGGYAGVATACDDCSYCNEILLPEAGLNQPRVLRAVVRDQPVSAPADRGGIASGVINAARQAGEVLRVAILGSLVSVRATFIGGLRDGLIVAGCAFLAGAALVSRDLTRR